MKKRTLRVADALERFVRLEWGISASEAVFRHMAEVAIVAMAAEKKGLAARQKDGEAT